jgi:hypothetical protein
VAGLNPENRNLKALWPLAKTLSFPIAHEHTSFFNLVSLLPLVAGRAAVAAWDALILGRLDGNS